MILRGENSKLFKSIMLGVRQMDYIMEHSDDLWGENYGEVLMQVLSDLEQIAVNLGEIENKKEIEINVVR